MFSFDVVRPPSTEALLVYGLAAWRSRGQMLHLRGCRREPGCHRQLPAARRAQAPHENLGSCKREITASHWDGWKEGSFPKLQLAGRLAGEGEGKSAFLLPQSPKKYTQCRSGYEYAFTS